MLSTSTTTINDDQLTFLTEELTRLKPESEAGTRAVVVAVHHPPASADAAHGGTTGLVLTAAAAALAATALVHLLMVSTPRPLMFFGWTCHAAGISGLSEAAAGAAQSSASRRREGC